MKLITGLGNPGEKYNLTRHNIGFMVIDHFLSANNFILNKNENFSQYATLNLNGQTFVVLKPLTFMNDSGKSVKFIKNKFNIDSSDILVIHDDLDLNTGRVRLKVTNSAGGHHGVESIMKEINKKDFLNLKIGIDHPKDQSVVSWVLGKFSNPEQKLLDESLNKSVNIINDFIQGSSSTNLMNQYNGQ